MARPARYNADYYTHTADLRNDRRVKAIRTKFGPAGYGLFHMLLEALTDADHTALDISALELELLAGDFGAEATEIEALIKFGLGVGYFALNDTGLLTCPDLSKWLEPVFEKRNRGKNPPAAALLPQPATEIGVSVTETPQSKVKESKEDNNTPDAEPASPSPAASASGLPPVEPCHLTAQSGGKQPTKLPVEKGPAFDEFWQAYGKKEDKKKASKAWAALNASQRTAALAELPRYVAATPDKRYRKNPLTWLNGECWQDEETPASRLVVAATPQPTPMLAPPAPALAPNLEFLAQQAAAEAAKQAAHFAKFSKPQPCSQPLSQPQA